MRIFIALVVIVFFSISATAKEPFKVGDIPPNFLGYSVENGKKIYLSDYKDRVVVLSFWASWCAPCRKELPVLAVMQKQIPTDRLQIIAVNFKQKKKVAKHLRKIFDDIPVLVTYEKGSVVSKRYGIKAIPHTLLIHPNGKIAAVHKGYSETSTDKLVSEINALFHNVLDGKKPRSMMP